MPELPVDEELMKMSHFPYPEGNYFEFKKNFCHINKLNLTICAFLNSKGGYLISGIEDTTLKIKGVNATVKDIDNYILSIDNIFHQKFIVKTSGEPIVPENIKTRYIKITEGIYIIIVRITPEKDEKYKLKNGSIFYRVNASNFHISSEKMFCQSEINFLISKMKTKIIKEYDLMIDYMKQDINKLEKKLKETEMCLNKKILDEKEEREKKIINQQPFYYNICSIFNF